MRVAFATFGCKINQYETDSMRREIESEGNAAVSFDDEADVYVINTCTVTSKSDSQCRQAIRSAIRRGNGARVVVTGCYAETRPDELRKISGVDLVVGNRDKAGISKLVSGHAPHNSAPADGDVLYKGVHDRTRGFLKIQDGCDNNCSYCIVPLARGRSRSVAQEDVIREFERRVSADCPEIVLSGIHVGRYGADLGTGTTLTRLVGELLGRCRESRIRLSSIEPGEVTDEIIGMLGRGLCRHLHIPLQSGDDSVLAAMKRNYTSGFYLDLVEGISERVPGIALGADVMVGFPGEGEKEFRNTHDLIEKSPLTHLHVFSFSPRPGTQAAAMKGQTPEKAKKERGEILRKLGLAKNFNFRKRNKGMELKAVVEAKRDGGTGFLCGITDNYIRAAVNGLKNEDIGKIISIRISDVAEKETVASIS